MVKRVFAVTLLIAGVIAIVWWMRSHAKHDDYWQGYVEADYIKVAPPLAGKLTSVSVVRGQSIKAGTPIFDQDDADDVAARDQYQQQLKQAEQQLVNLESPGKQTEIRQAEANLADAEAARDKIKTDLQINERVLEVHGISEQAVQQERADLRSAIAKVAAQQAALAQMTAPIGRKGEINTQMAAVETARAVLAQARWRLEQRHMNAPTGGVIADVLARKGETLNAGEPVVSLLPPENIFIRFFIPEAMLSHIHRGDMVALSCDRCPKDLTGQISFIAPTAEYTPPVIFSEESRAKLVYMIEARPPASQEMQWNPGEPVVVRPISIHGAE